MSRFEMSLDCGQGKITVDGRPVASVSNVTVRVKGHRPPRIKLTLDTFTGLRFVATRANLRIVLRPPQGCRSIAAIKAATPALLSDQELEWLCQIAELAFQQLDQAVPQSDEWSRPSAANEQPHTAA